jgi:RNA polymerase sigma-70 factor (ECF subfamily)
MERIATPTGQAGEAEGCTDEELVARILRGEKQHFQSIMRRNGQRLFHLLKSYMRDESEAEEALQSGYVRAYEHLHQFQGKAKFSTWLTRIVINEALGRIRSRRRMVSIDDAVTMGEVMVPLFSPRRDPENEAMRRQLRVRLEQAVESLPRKYRVVFLLREVNGLSTEETSEHLGIGEEAVKTRLFRARTLLRRRLAFGTN